MPQIDNLHLGPLGTNAYVVRDPGSSACIVIDPGGEANRLLAFLQENRLTLEAILLTHGHFDHVGAVRDLAATTGCRVYLNPLDTAMPPTFTAGPLYYSDPYPGNGQLQVAGLSVRALHTPGHTPGSMCLIIDDALFTGDTLFARSCGRTDLPGGDPAALAQSLRKLRQLPGDYRVFPGHEDFSTLERERRLNPYLR